MTMLLQPELGYGSLVERLWPLGWTMVQAAASPIVPGEPEHALFERPVTDGSGVERLVYTFNPVCRLRVLDVSGAAEAAPLARALPGAGRDDVAAWLASDDERVVLRGLLAAELLGDASLAAAAARHAAHPRASIAEVAKRVAQRLSASPREARARGEALAAIEVLKAQLEPLLKSLAQDRDGRLSAALRPRPGDAARAFRPEFAAAVEQAYDAVWETAPRVARASTGCRIECRIAPAGMLASDNELSRTFPGGYRAAAALMQPQRVWAAWKVIEPGHDAGMAYDGLVWLDDRWVWFPKPWRALRHLLGG